MSDKSNDSPQQDAHKQQPNLLKPSDYQIGVYAKGLQGQAPVMSFNCSNWEEEARKTLSRTSFGYVYGSAGSNETSDNNVKAFRNWGLVPSRLIQIKQVDLTTTLFGRKLAYPIGLAPVGVQDLFHWRKEIAASKAASECGVPFTLSTAASSTIEEVAEANGSGERWYQLYWPINEANTLTASFLKRAKAAGFKVLVVTLDTYALGWRPMDLDKGYNPFILPNTTGVQIAFSDPEFRKVWREKSGKEVEESMTEAAVFLSRLVLPGYSHTWEDLSFLKEHWDGPIVLKGIQTVLDAKKAVEAGMAGIVVSNHGGRQTDGSVASLDVLPEIAEAVGSDIDIIFDSGVRNGVDIAKALALGAKFVLIGRPFVYGLAVDGEEGVKHVIRALLGELEMTLQLSGIASVSKHDLNRTVLRRITPIVAVV